MLILRRNSRLGLAALLVVALSIACVARAQPETDEAKNGDRDEDNHQNEHQRVVPAGTPSRETTANVQHETGQLPFIEGPILEWLRERHASSRSAAHIDKLLSSQHSYDFRPRLRTVDIVRRSGFKFTVHNCTSQDGYVTQLIRIRNPLVAAHKLKKPPMILYGGQGISPALFLMASTTGHHPVAWPPSTKHYNDNKSNNHESEHEDDLGLSDEANSGEGGNRSLAFMLSNKGYDVWLVPARGVDEENRFRIHEAPKENDSPGGAWSLREFVRKLGDQPDSYWSFSSDEIIRWELRTQLELVMRVSKCEKVTLIVYSGGAFGAFGLMAREPRWAEEHVDTLVAIAPLVFANKLNLWLGLTSLLSHIPVRELGGSAASGYSPVVDSFDASWRDLADGLCRSRSIRYTLCKLLADSYYGHSDTFETFFELVVLDYILKPVSPHAIQQLLQTSWLEKLRHFDHGPLVNLLLYGSLEPEEYNLRNIKLPRVFLLAGSRDAVADIDRLSLDLVGVNGKRGARASGIRCIKVEGFNHLDMLIGADVALKVNKPILDILEDHHLEEAYDNGHQHHRGIDEGDHHRPQEDNDHPSEGHHQDGEHHQEASDEEKTAASAPAAKAVPAAKASAKRDEPRGHKEAAAVRSFTIGLPSVTTEKANLETSTLLASSEGSNLRALMPPSTSTLAPQLHVWPMQPPPPPETGARVSGASGRAQSEQRTPQVIVFSKEYIRTP